MLTHNFNMNASQLGTTAEAYTKYKLLSWGYPVHETQEGLGYDLVVQAKGDLFKVQVKGTASRSHKKDVPYLVFSTMTGNKQKYVDGAYDILAMVDLISEKVLFMVKPDVKAVWKREIDFNTEEDRESFRNAYREVNNERIRRQHTFPDSRK